MAARPGSPEVLAALLDGLPEAADEGDRANRRPEAAVNADGLAALAGSRRAYRSCVGSRTAGPGGLHRAAGRAPAADRVGTQRPGVRGPGDRGPLLDPRSLPGVGDHLRHLAELVRPAVFRSHVYDLVVQRFVAEHHSGGWCRDALGFLMRGSVERDADRDLQRAMGADFEARSAPGERAWLPVGVTSIGPHAGVMYQVATGPLGDPEQPVTVVNNFGSGTGSLLARFAHLLGEEFRGQLEDHIRGAWADLPVRELTLWTEANTAQAECSGILPPLLVPGEPDAPDGLALQDCGLAHDPVTDTLALTDPRGEPFGLTYLGLTPRHLLQGYLRLLGVLADPWINGSPHSDYTVTKYALLAELSTDHVEELPRVVQRGLVTRRRSWVVPRGMLPDIDGSDRDLCLAASRLREEHGMPEEVFIHQLGGFGAPMTGLRKPTWTSWSSPTCLRVALGTLAPQTAHVRVVEALPASTGHVQRDPDGRPRATEHCQLLAWPRPPCDPARGGMS
ncbi:MAG: hypothetical protein R2731_00805 [Nocardioides sp.]